MNVLIACEFSGTVRDAFRRLGHDAMSCDFIPTSKPGPHYLGDVRDVLNEGWDLMIAHPPCTYLTNSAEWCYKDNPGKKMRPGVLFGAERRAAREEAIEFVRMLMDAPIPHIAIENPVGCLSSRLRKPDQIIQPWQFGDDASKATCLWLKNLPKLNNTDRSKWKSGRVVGEDKKGRTIVRWANQTDSGQNRLAPSDDRWAERSITYQGIANAMADAWGAYVEKKLAA